MRYDIEALKRKMLVKYPFFGSVVANVGYKESIEISTAGTDGETIYYNPEYLGRLNRDEQTFVFAHEVCHIAFNHVLRSKGKDLELWNIATDGVINQLLKKDGLKLATGGVDMADAINYDAEQLYEKLLQEKQQQQSQNGQENSQNQGGSSSGESSHEQIQKGDSEHQSQSGSQDQENSQNEQQSSNESQNSRNEQQSEAKNQDSSGSNSSKNQKQNGRKNQQSSGGSSDSLQQEEQDSSKKDVGHDTHSLWEEAVKKQEKEQSKFEKKQNKLEEIGEKAAFRKNREDYKKQLEELKQAIAKQASTVGKSTNREIRTVEDMGASKSLIDWRYVLRDAIKYNVDWSYKNATIEDGIVVANLEKQPMPETEILLDTSGSIDDILLRNFLRECKHILQHSRLKVGCFDTEFYGFHEIRTEKDIESMRFEGGGGTDFEVAVGAFSRRVENKIIFTDGVALMPNMPIDAIWIVFGNKKINPKGGKVINITGEQLDRLCSYELVNRINGKSR